MFTHSVADKHRSTTLLLSDSIMRNIGFLPNTDVVVYPGRRIEFFDSLLRAKADKLGQYKLVVVHAGTNDIQRQSKQQILDSYDRVIRTFKAIHTQGQLAISCILPRPRDEHWSGEKVKHINKYLIAHCRENGVLCFRTFSPFLSRNRARRDLFRDGLHLNEQGDVLLTDFPEGSAES